MRIKENGAVHFLGDPERSSSRIKNSKRFEGAGGFKYTPVHDMRERGQYILEAQTHGLIADNHTIVSGPASLILEPVAAKRRIYIADQNAAVHLTCCPAFVTTHADTCVHAVVGELLQLPDLTRCDEMTALLEELGHFIDRRVGRHVEDCREPFSEGCRTHWREHSDDSAITERQADGGRGEKLRGFRALHDRLTDVAEKTIKVSLEGCSFLSVEMAKLLREQRLHLRVNGTLLAARHIRVRSSGHW